MVNNRAFVVGGIFGGIIATIAVGNILSHCRNTNAETTDDNVSYSDAVNAIVSNTDIFSTIKEEIISAMPTNMSSDIYKSIICIAQDENMLNATKRNTILQICERFREKNKPYNERM